MAKFKTIYSDNQKFLKKEDDIQNQGIALKSPINMRHSNCSDETDH